MTGVVPIRNVDPRAESRVGAVYVVGGEPSDWAAVVEPLRGQGYVCREFQSSDAFLAQTDIEQPACVVLEDGGLAAELLEPTRNAISLPVIVTIGEANVSRAVRLMEQGAATVLPRPVRTDDLLAAVVRALSLDTTRRRARQLFDQIHTSVERLSARESSVLDAILAGDMNKSIAKELDVSVRTVEGDRAKIVDKFGAEHTGEVVARYAQYRLMLDLGFGSSGVRSRF